MLFGHQKFQKIYIRVNALHESVKFQSQEKKKILIECVNTINKLGLFLFINFLGAVIMFGLYPVYAYFFENRRELMLGVHVPFVNHTTLQGYVITMITQLAFETYAVIGISAFDIIFMMFIFHTVAFTKLLQVDLREFSIYLMVDDPKERHRVNEKLEDLITKHREIIE